MAKFGEEIEGDRFAEPVAQRIKEGFIEEVKEKPLTAAEKKKLKDEEERIQKEKDEAAAETERLLLQQKKDEEEAENQRQQMKKVPADTDNQEMIDHVVTEDDLSANKELVENGVKVGDTIQIPKVSDVPGNDDTKTDASKSETEVDKTDKTDTPNPLDKLKSGK